MNDEYADFKMEKLPIGISSCLLGQEVRFDGGHKHNRYITASLGEYFEYFPFCPEVAIGMGIPRPTIQLVRFPEGIRVRGVKDKEADFTEALSEYGKSVIPKIDELCGYIFKKGSPSCGVERVKVYNDKNMPSPDGTGAYAAEIIKAFPDLPIEEEGRLMDPRIRENFIERVFVMQRWHALQKQGMDAQGLINFHRRHKFILQAHSEVAYRELGQLVSEAGKHDMQELAPLYLSKMMKGLKKIASRGKHANVLMHVFGFFKNNMNSEDKQELLQIIDEYRTGIVPLIVPMTLLKHYLRRYPQEYIQEQYYMDPHPSELMLRNHV